jgi:hypothetical protein
MSWLHFHPFGVSGDSQRESRTSEILAAHQQCCICYASNFHSASFQCVRIADPRLPCCSLFRFSANVFDFGLFFAFLLARVAVRQSQSLKR